MSMQPSAAGHPGPEELTAYADGEASADVIAHVAGCAICSDQAASDVRAQRVLRRALYRFDCPDAHTLGEYQLDLLDAAQRTSIAAHATECQECRAELRTLRAYLAASTAVHESVVERVRRIVASVFTPAPGLAYDGLRGAAEVATQVFDTGDITVTVGPGQTPGALIGLVLPPVRTIGGRDLSTPERGVLIGAIAVAVAALLVAAVHLGGVIAGGAGIG